MRGNRVIFYNDASEFGGHEIMSAFFANELSNTNQVTYYCSTPELKKLLSSEVEIIPLPFHSKKGIFSLPFNLNPSDIHWLKKRFQKHRPDFVIIVQGAVDISLRGAIAARLSNLLTLNYIPYHFSRNLMGLSGGWFFDSYFSWFFHLFDGIITISDHQKRLIQSFVGKNKNIYILENCVSFENKRNSVFNNQYNGKIG
ncbi:MAG: glycosyltransferase family 4 protein, partial [Promethearchaeota archaeon]